MTILQTQKELERAIEHINAEFAECRKSILETFGEEILSPVSDNFSMMLEVKTESDLFTDQEREVLEAVNGLVANILQAHSIYLHEELRIKKAKKEREDYPERISADNETDLDLYIEQLKKLDDRMTAPYKELMYLSSNVQSLGWKRYFDSYEGDGFQRDVRKECKAIANSLHIIATSLETEEDPEETSGMLEFLEKYGAVSVLGRIDTKYYGKTVRVVLQTANIAEDSRRKVLKDLIEPLFARHKEALKERRLPAEDALRDIIDDTLDRLLGELTPLVEHDSTDTRIIRTMPLNSLAFPMTEITRDLFSNSAFSPVTNKPMFMYNKKGNRNNPVNIFYSTSLADVEGVEIAKNLSLEEEGICNAIYSHFMVGNRYVTNQMIKNARNKLGGKSEKRITDKEDTRYTKFISNAEYIKVTIDQRQYAKERGLPQTALEDSLLSVSKAYNVNINGTVVPWCWYIKQAPIINEHAEIIGRQLSLPIDVVSADIPAEHYPLRDYLVKEIHRIKGDPLNTETASEKEVRLKAEELKRAEVMAEGKTYKPRKKRQHPVILFSSIYETVYGSQNLRTDKKKNIQKYTQIILGGWKATGQIKNYKLQYNGLNRKSSGASKSKSLLADAIEIDVTKSEVIQG